MISIIFAKSICKIKGIFSGFRRRAHTAERSKRTMMMVMMAMMASRKLGNTWSRLLLTDVQGTQLSNLQMFFFRTIYNLKLAILLLQL